MTTVMNDKHPTPDPAEDNAFFPSAYSLSQFTASKSDLSGAHYPTLTKADVGKSLSLVPMSVI